MNKASKGYGSLGKLVKPGTYFEPEEPDHADYGSFDPTEDADGLNKIAYLEEMKNGEKKRQSKDIYQNYLLWCCNTWVMKAKKKFKDNKIGMVLRKKIMQKNLEVHWKDKNNTATQFSSITKLFARIT